MKNIRSVERAIDILLSFTSARSSMDIGELEQTIGLARPTLYRMLKTLENKGLIQSYGDPRRYELGHRVMDLANTWTSQIEVLQVARPILQELWEVTGETIALNIPVSPIQRMGVLELKSRQALAFSTGLGYTAPMHVGAAGKVMLAYSATGDIERDFGAIKGKAGAKRLAAELTTIREQGYSVSRGEVIVGAIAIAAPVFSREAEVVAAVTMYGPEARLKGRSLRQGIKLVSQSAKRVSSFLGYPN